MAPNVTSGIQTICARHRQVHKDDVGMKSFGHPQGRLTIVSFTCDLKRGIGADENSQTFPNDVVVFRNQNFNVSRHTKPDRGLGVARPSWLFSNNEYVSRA